MTDGFFIAKNECLADLALDPEPLLKLYPDVYGPRFQALKELRDLDDGTLHKGNEFRRVASFTNIPLAQAVFLMDPEFMKDPKKFYAFLRRNRRYATYQIKSHTLAPRYTSTVVDGKVV